MSSRSRRNIVRGTVIRACREGSARPRSGSTGPELVSSSSASNGHVVYKDSTRLSAEFFSNLLQDYTTIVLPFLPIVSENEFASAIAEKKPDQTGSAFVKILGAITLNMRCSWLGEEETDRNQINLLYTQALQQRGALMPDHQITVRTLVIPLFAATCILDINPNSDMGVYYLREAITGIQILGVDDPSRAVRLDASDRAQQERLYWVLFIHERLLSITSRRRPTLSALPNLLQPDPTIPEGVLKGFNQIILLFKTIDDTFMTHWIDRQAPTLTMAWIEEKQSQLSGINDDWEDQIKELSQMQQIDLLVTRDWLRTLVWQVALSRFFLTSDGRPSRHFMDITFPALISRRLRMMLTATPRQAVEIHGTGILHKVFEIVSMLGDLLELVLHATCDDRTIIDHLDDYSFLYTFLNSMSKFDPVEQTILNTRFMTVQAQYPALSTLTGTG
ncbi:hypothetical protein LTR84_005976 [Exophiala bonariae]|uniref:Transcription factor domain-containing protein n=1 Tax=Exophiala bonariae TaxID=1690606 RepID=A0AAV9N2N1_9EURO|nr:hypothetical protein LTR84_005976 [Exophiala bonariae]